MGLYKPNMLPSITPDDIMNTGNVLEIIMAAKKEQLLKKHPYTITEPKSRNGRWQTYYKGIDGKRKIIRAQSKDALLEKLVLVYSQAQNFDKLIFSGLFEEWLEYKKTVTGSPNTIKRHVQHYRRYFERSKLHDMPVCQIDTLTLESECNRIVKEYNMSRREWNNVKIILTGSFEYAVRKKYIKDSPMDKVKILVKFKQVAKKSGRTETFNTEELRRLNQYLDKMYVETKDPAFMAVRLNLFLGLRVGELVGIMYQDIVDNTHLHIVRMEVRDQTTNTYRVVEHTKTNQDRFVFLVPKAVEILNRIERQGDFIFMRDGERITSRQIAYVLEKYAERQGVATKSSHKIRKTYASILNANGVPLDCIREMLGHCSLSTTLGYVFNPLTESETNELITKAL